MRAFHSVDRDLRRSILHNGVQSSSNHTMENKRMHPPNESSLDGDPAVQLECERVSVSRDVMRNQ